MKFIYTRNIDSDSPLMLINTHIGVNDKGEKGIMGDVFQNEFLELQRLGKKKVEIWINSGGGSVIDGWAIYGTIVNSQIEVTTINIGMAASTAGWIFEAGHNRVMMDYSNLMMHNVHSTKDSAPSSVNTSIATMLAAKSNKTVDEVLGLMNKTTFMTADEALSCGFCDTIKESGNLSKRTSMAFATIEDACSYGNNWLQNTLVLNTSKMELNDILNLKNEASEQAQIEAVKAIIEAKNTALADLELSNNAKKGLEEQLQSAKETYDTLKSQYDAILNEKSEVEEAAKVAEAKNEITKFAEIGKIKNDKSTIESWVNTAKTLGLEAVKGMLEDLPLNVQAPNPDGDVMKDVKFAVTNVDEYKNQFKNN